MYATPADLRCRTLPLLPSSPPPGAHPLPARRLLWELGELGGTELGRWRHLAACPGSREHMEMLFPWIQLCPLVTAAKQSSMRLRPVVSALAAHLLAQAHPLRTLDSPPAGQACDQGHAGQRGPLLRHRHLHHPQQAGQRLLGPVRGGQPRSGLPTAGNLQRLLLCSLTCPATLPLPSPLRLDQACTRLGSAVCLGIALALVSPLVLAASRPPTPSPPTHPRTHYFTPARSPRCTSPPKPSCPPPPWSSLSWGLA